MYFNANKRKYESARDAAGRNVIGDQECNMFQWIRFLELLLSSAKFVRSLLMTEVKKIK